MSKNSHRGSSLDKFLAEEGVLEKFRATAIREVIAWQTQQAMTDKNLKKNKRRVHP